jgi:predicted DNA-binding protein with PD1-like motif
LKAKLIDDARQKTYALVFETGDDVCERLLSFAREHDIDCAQLSGLGAFSRVVLGYFDWEKKEYERIPVEEQVELLSLVGDIARAEDGGPKLHAHVVIGRRDGSARGGHLIDARVRPTLELILVESPAHLRRRSDPETGLALISL